MKNKGIKMNRGSAMGDLIWVVAIVAILGILWFALGGAKRASNLDTPFLLNPYANIFKPIGIQVVPGALTPSSQGQGSGISVPGAHRAAITLQNGSAATQDPNKQYVEIVASNDNTEPVNITGWTLVSGATGASDVIKQGAYLPYAGQINNLNDIALVPGAKAVVTTGRAPSGSSFRLNTCTGYFEQFQDFAPSLPLTCPYPKNENLPTGVNGLDDACLDYIDTLQRCTINVSGLPLTLNSTCQNYINQKITYSTCVDTHKNEPDFYKKEWRIFLGRDTPLWKEKRETIKLLDSSGATVSSFSY
jgi:hypothetical protein